MNDPILTLFKLTDIIQDLDEVQAWIDRTRTALPNNRVIQSALNHKQIEIDQKRMLVAGLMADIRNRN